MCNFVVLVVLLTSSLVVIARAADSGASKSRGVEVIRDPKLVQDARDEYCRHWEAEIRARLDTLEDSPLYDADLIAKLRQHDEIVVPALRSKISEMRLGEEEPIRSTTPNAPGKTLTDPTPISKQRAAAAVILVIWDDSVGEEATLRILREGNQNDRDAVFHALTWTGKKLPHAFTQSSEFRSALTALLNASDVHLRSQAIWASEQFGLPNVKQAVQKLWNERPAKPTHHLLSQFARYAPSLELVAIIEDRLAAGEEPTWCVRDLREVIEHGSTEVRAEAVRVLAEHTKSRSKNYDLSEVMEILAPAAGHDQLPLLRRLVEHSDFRVAEHALTALGRLEGEAGLDRLLKALGDRRLHNQAVRLLAQHGRGTQDDRLVDALKSAVDYEVRARRSDFPLYYGLVVDALLEIGGSSAEKAVRDLTPRLMPHEQWAVECRLRGWDVAFIARRLKELDVLPPSWPPQERDRAEEQLDENHRLNFELVGLLSEAGVCFVFDLETGQVPCPHDDLLFALGEHARGLFRPEACLQLGAGGGSNERQPEHYDVQFIYRDRLYRFKASNAGDYYDSDGVIHGANYALRDHAFRERFTYVPFDEGQCMHVVFADPLALSRARDEGLLPGRRHASSSPTTSEP